MCDLELFRHHYTSKTNALLCRNVYCEVPKHCVIHACNLNIIQAYEIYLTNFTMYAYCSDTYHV